MPRYRLVLDPVDGSDNWVRELPLSALSCAVLLVDAPLHPDWVEAALVGPFEQDTPLIAIKGSGAWRGKERLRTFGVRSVAGAMISVKLNHHSPSPGLARLMAAARGVRCYGCASRAISLVAEKGESSWQVPSISILCTAVRPQVSLTPSWGACPKQRFSVNGQFIANSGPLRQYGAPGFLCQSALTTSP